jgi:hypothetical protein
MQTEHTHGRMMKAEEDDEDEDETSTQIIKDNHDKFSLRKLITNMIGKI